MKSEWILLNEIKDNYGNIIYQFKHCEKVNCYKYYHTIIGDGFVQTEEINNAEFFKAIKKLEK